MVWLNEKRKKAGWWRGSDDSTPTQVVPLPHHLEALQPERDVLDATEVTNASIGGIGTKLAGGAGGWPPQAESIRA